jgi:SlyX protein
MEELQHVDQRLTDLEIKSSFNEDLLDQLNQVVIRQQEQIDRLVREVTRLRDQMPDAGANALRRPADDLPPHY